VAAAMLPQAQQQAALSSTQASNQLLLIFDLLSILNNENS